MLGLFYIVTTQISVNLDVLLAVLCISLISLGFIKHKCYC